MMTEPASLPSPAVVHGAHAVFFALMAAGLYSIGVDYEVLRATGWWMPFVTVHLGIFAGNIAMASLFSSPDAAAEIEAEGRREDLIHNRGVVIEQLRNLESEKSKLDPEDYARERAQLVSVGAQAARELEEGREGAAAESIQTQEPSSKSMLQELVVLRDRDPAAFKAALASLGVAPTAGGMSGEWRGAGYTLGIVALAALLFSMAGEGSRDRRPGETMTGGDQTMSEQPAAQAPADPRIDSIRQRLQADPKNLELLNQLTELSLSNEDLAGAMEANRQALEVAPQDPGARVYRAVLLAFINKRDEAFKILDEVAESNPGYAKSFVYKGLLTLRTDPAAAVVAFEKAMAIEDTPELRQALAQAKMMAAGGGGSAPPPTAPPPPAGASEVLASGTITLGEGVSPDGTLFVFGRQPGSAGGPPMIALKLPASPFPQTFTLTKANMLPMFARMPLPDALDIGVRLDADGDAASRAEGEPEAKLAGVEIGSTNLTIELR